MACAGMMSWTVSPLLTLIPVANFSQVLGIIVLRTLSSGLLKILRYGFNGKWLKMLPLVRAIHSYQILEFSSIRGLTKSLKASMVCCCPSMKWCSWVLSFNLYQQASLFTLIWSVTLYLVFSIHLWINQRRPIKSGNKEYRNSWSFINACM